MISIPVEQVIEKIKEKSGLSGQEIEQKVQEKLTQLSGLISKEGAVHIIANELGIQIFEKVSGRLKIEKVLPGMRDVEVVGKVTNIFPISEFTTKDGKPGKVGSFILGDETGTIKITLWHDQTDNLAQLKPDMIVKVVSGYVRENNGNKEIHLNDRSKIIPSPQGETIGEVKRTVQSLPVKRKKIVELSEQDSNAELLGTIVRVFDLRFFEVCPNCGKRARLREDNFNCDAHGKVIPAYSYVLNLFLDDGSENIRVIFFSQQVEKLLNMNNEQLIKFRDSPQDFEEKKNSLLGEIIKVGGRVVKNDMFDRIEFITNSVDTNPDPGEEIKKVESEIQNDV